MQGMSGILRMLVLSGAVLFATAAAQAQDAWAAGDEIGSLGNCCVDQIGPGCNNPACEDTVCTADPACCDPENGWDCVCANLAAFACTDICLAGDNDCCISRDGAGCSDQTCQDLVCAADPFCCSGFWDEACAAGLVGGGGGACSPTPDGADNLCGDLCNVVGDCARDFMVSLDDYGAFLLCVTGAGGGPVQGRCECADLDDDGDADLIDWSVLQIILSE